MVLEVILLIVICFSALILYMYIEARRNIVVFHELHFHDLPKSFDGYKIFFISDLHFRIISEVILAKIKGEADLIIIGGDILEKNVQFKNVETNIRKLTEIAPTFFVWGNNDYEGDVERLQQVLQKYQVTILKNDAVSITKNHDRISLIGVDNGKRRVNLQKALKEARDDFKIFVSHTPDIRRQLPKDEGIRLFLSGHTHGGQIRLFGIGIREKGMLKKVGEMWVLISNGYGTTRVHLRLGAKPETHLLTLKTK